MLSFQLLESIQEETWDCQLAAFFYVPCKSPKLIRLVIASICHRLRLESNCSGTLSRYWSELGHISCSHCPFGFYNSDAFLPQSQHFVSVHLECEPADHGLNHCIAASLFVLARVSSLPHLKGGVVTAWLLRCTCRGSVDFAHHSTFVSSGMAWWDDVSNSWLGHYFLVCS